MSHWSATRKLLFRQFQDSEGEIRSAVSTVLRRQEMGGGDGDGRSIVDRAICSEPLARLYGDWMRFAACGDMAGAALAAWMGRGHRHEDEDCGVFRLMAEVMNVGAGDFEHRGTATR